MKQLTPQERLLRQISEAALARKIIDLAEMTGWWWHHARPAWDGGRFKTPLGGMKGFPDYVFARYGRVLIAELKTQLGALTIEQIEWARRLRPTGAYRLWRPSDWPEIEAELTGQVALELPGPNAGS